MKAEFLTALRGIWWVGIACWSFGICDRTLASFSDGFLGAIDLMQLFTAAALTVMWVFLRPR